MMNYGGLFASVYPDERTLARFIHLPPACIRKTERLSKVVKVNLGDVTTATDSRFPSHTPKQAATYAVHTNLPGTMCPLYGG